MKGIHAQNSSSKKKNNALYGRVLQPRQKKLFGTGCATLYLRRLHNTTPTSHPSSGATRTEPRSRTCRLISKQTDRGTPDASNERLAKLEVRPVEALLERLPIPTLAAHIAQPAHGAHNLLLALDKLQPEALSDVERDVAVHEPDARVVALKGEHEVALARQRGRVAADRVVGAQRRQRAVPGRVGGLGEHVEVVPVEVDGVREEGGGVVVLLDDPVLEL